MGREDSQGSNLLSRPHLFITPLDSPTLSQKKGEEKQEILVAALQSNGRRLAGIGWWQLQSSFSQKNNDTGGITLKGTFNS